MHVVMERIYVAYNSYSIVLSHRLGLWEKEAGGNLGGLGPLGGVYGFLWDRNFHQNSQLDHERDQDAVPVSRHHGMFRSR